MDSRSTVGKVVISIIVGIVTALILILIGNVLVTINQATVIAVGDFLRDYAGLFGLLAGVFYFFTGRTPRDIV